MTNEAKTGWTNPDAKTAKAETKSPKEGGSALSIEAQVEEAMKSNDAIDKKELMELAARYRKERSGTIESSKDRLGNLLKEALLTMLKNGFTLKNAADVEFVTKNVPAGYVLPGAIADKVAKGESVTVRLGEDGKTLEESGVFAKVWNYHHEDLYDISGIKGIALKKDVLVANFRALSPEKKKEMKARILELAARIELTPSADGDPQNARRTEEAYVAELVFEIERGKKGNAREIPNVRMKNETHAKEIADFLRSLIRETDSPTGKPVAVVEDKTVAEERTPDDKKTEKANEAASKKFLEKNPEARADVEEFLKRNPQFREAFEKLVSNPKIQTVTHLQLAIGIPSEKADPDSGRADGIFGNKTARRLGEFLKGNESVREVDEITIMLAIKKSREIRAERRKARKQAEEMKAALPPTKEKTAEKDDGAAEDEKKSAIDSIGMNGLKRRVEFSADSKFDILLAIGDVQKEDGARPKGGVLKNAEFVRDLAEDGKNGYLKFRNGDGKEYEFHVHEIVSVTANSKASVSTPAKTAEVPTADTERAEFKKRAELQSLQREVLKNLKPSKDGDYYFVDTEFLKDGVSYPVYFRFDKEAWEWTYAAYGPEKWYKISAIEAATVNGVTKMSSFGFVKSVQETVNAALAAQKKALEYGMKLTDPNAPSPNVSKIPR